MGGYYKSLQANLSQLRSLSFVSIKTAAVLDVATVNTHT